MNSDIKNRAEAYSSIVCSRLTYEEYQKLESRIQAAYLEGFKSGCDYSAAKVASLQDHSSIVGYTARDLPNVIASILRDCVQIQLGIE